MQYFVLVAVVTLQLALLSQAKQPNLVFFFPDTLRAESFNSYGNKVPGVTPVFDAFAAEGTRFEQTHVMHTQCSPSRATMMTGRYMHTLGHRTQIHLIQAYEENYWRLLKEDGYDVQWFGKNDALSPSAFNKSVSNWTNTIGYDSGGNRFPFGESGYWSMLSTGGTTSGTDPKHSGDFHSVKSAVEYMKNRPKEPFAIFLPTRGAHPPYGAPVDFKNKWTLEEIKAAVKLRDAKQAINKPKYHSATHGIPHYRNLTGLDEDIFYTIQKSYLEMIAYTDYTFGVLLKGIEDAGLKGRTAVFASSDHGDFAGDYGLIEKWPGGADDVLTRVPLAIRIPGGKVGHVSKAPVQTADIMETMIDLAGIKSNFVRFAKSLRQICDGEEGDMSRMVYSEGGFYFRSELFPGGSDHVPNNPRGMYWPRAQEEMSGNLTGSPKWVMVRNLTAKLVYRPEGVSELYDLTCDQREMKNVFGSSKYSRLQTDLMAHLTAWLLQTGDVPPLKTDPRNMPEYPSVIDEASCTAAMEPTNPTGNFENELPSSILAVNGIPHFV